MAAALAAVRLASPLGAAPEPAKFGHKFYAEAKAKDLAVAGVYRTTGRKAKLRREAAAGFKKMAAAARQDGIKLIPISAFRPVYYQKTLFDRAVKRYGSEEKAARWVAPPGHSEHATGWALDLGEEDTPGSDVEVGFEDTKAFAWLAANAARFHFELSFPKNNAQGVNYEPWHWRYVGTDEARALFRPK